MRNSSLMNNCMCCMHRMLIPRALNTAGCMAHLSCVRLLEQDLRINAEAIAREMRGPGFYFAKDGSG